MESITLGVKPRSELFEVFPRHAMTICPYELAKIDETRLDKILCSTLKLLILI